MKNKWLFFMFLMLFILVNGFGQQNSSTGEAAPQGSLVPLTFNIVKMIESEGGDLFKELGYYLSSDLALTTFPERKIQANTGGGLVIDDGKIVQITKILRASKGEYIKSDKYEPQESFIIKFQGYDHALQFVREPQTNRFYFRAVVNVPTSFEAPAPYLCIRQIGASFRNSSVGWQSSYPAPHVGTATWQSSTSRIPAATDQFPVYIMGSGRLRRDAVVSYIVNKGSAMNRQQVNTLVGLYIKEAGEEGVNHDIAIAQMCYATKSLSNWQLLNTRNYGGLNTDLGISVKYGSWHGNMEEGVRAHIQHLKGYASPVRPQKDIVDGRYNLLVTSGYRGRYETLDSLFAVWSPHNPNYGYEIRKILRELYQFSGRI
jgi:hypothetical protein